MSHSTAFSVLIAPLFTIFPPLCGIERSRIQKLVEHKKAELAVLENTVSSVLTNGGSLHIPNVEEDSIQFDTRSSDEVNMGNLLGMKDELAELEGSLRHFDSSEPEISVRDIESMLKHFGVHIKRPELEYMLWEVNDTGSGQICWDQYQLVYYRNIVAQESANEPVAFSQILEYLLYDMNVSLLLPSISVLITSLSRTSLLSLPFACVA